MTKNLTDPFWQPAFYDYPITIMNESRDNRTTLDDYQRYGMFIGFGILSAFGFLSNLAVVLYVLIKRLYRNFVSSIFIGHLAFTNALACACLLPIFLQNLYDNGQVAKKDMLCRLHTFLECTIWAVSYYMTTCIAGVHLLTFARIHYDQLFGLHPAIICVTSWLIGISLGLPCLTNGSIVSYDKQYFYCLWQDNPSGFKFLAYLVLLGIFLPICLTSYAYVRVLAIFYHAPIVFETLGIFKSRYLIFAFLATPLLQCPFFVGRFIDIHDPLIPPIFMFLAFAPAITHSVLYGVSIFLMKEDDMALTARSHKATYQAPGIPAQEL